MKTKTELLAEAYKLLENSNVISPAAAHVRIAKAFALIAIAKEVD